MQITKLLYALLLGVAAQQNLAVKQPDNMVPAQTEAEKIQAGFTTLIDKAIEQYMIYSVKPTAQEDQQALEMIKKYSSLLTEENLQKTFGAGFSKSALYIIQHIPALQIKIWELFSAMQGGDLAIFNALLSRLPDTNKLVLDGKNLLEVFFDAIHDFETSAYPFTETEKQEARANQLKILQILIAAGANINKPIEEGASTPLSRAIQAGNMQIINYLIAKGTKVNPPDNAPLIAAIHARNLDAIKLFIQKGADINQPVNVGSNTLYPLLIVLEDFSHRPQATPESITPLIKTLLDMGADINAKNKIGEREMTALDAALLMQREDIAKLLISRGAKRLEELAKK